MFKEFNCKHPSIAIVWSKCLVWQPFHVSDVLVLLLIVYKEIVSLMMLCLHTLLYMLFGNAVRKLQNTVEVNQQQNSLQLQIGYGTE